MKSVIFFWLFIGVLALASCREESAHESLKVLTGDELNEAVATSLEKDLNDMLKGTDQPADFITLRYPQLVYHFYSNNGFKGVWYRDEKRLPVADSLLQFIDGSKNYGLYPGVYHQQELTGLQKRYFEDSTSVKDPDMWARLELFSTDAFFHVLRDIKEGRIVPDSNSIAGKDNFKDSFFVSNLKVVLQQHAISRVFNKAEPTFFKYQQLKALLPAFVKDMDNTRYPEIVFPFKDSILFVKEVFSRITNTDSLKGTLPDSFAFAAAVKSYQKEKGLEADGRVGTATVRELNSTDERKFRNIAISMDRYKMLPKMPEDFVWVNIPSFHLQVLINDSVALESKTIVGKPSTPTPELRSGINNLVVYPNWTIPASIISKEILPALKRNPDYLSEKGYDLFDNKGEIINPYGINWARYSTGIPWKVVQGSGDDNALGVFKFNFSNPYAVYLHDTNQRYLFANSNRALSHGCVRVQKWEQLADIIARRDSSLSDPSPIRYSKDSIKTWVAEGVRKTVTVRNKFPIYLVYYTCEAVNGKLQFYSDLYNADNKLFSEFFAAPEKADLVAL